MIKSSTILSAIDEIERALAKPDYAEVYLNNAIRFLKEGVERSRIERKRETRYG
jgi:hypothetical protein